MTIAIPRSTGRARGSSTGFGVSASFGSLPAAGSTIIVMVGLWPQSLALTASQFTDNQGNTYAIAESRIVAGGNEVAIIAYAKNIGSPSGTFTVTFTPANNGSFFDFCAIEVTGLDGTSPLDKTAKSGGTSGTIDTTATATTSQADELLVACCARRGFGGFTVSSGWTEQVEENDDVSWQPMEGDTQIVAATGTYSATWNNVPNNVWTACIATFKGGTAPPPASTRKMALLGVG